MAHNRFKQIFEVSIIKTVIFNFHYFGLRGLIKIPIIVYKNFILYSLKGKIYLNDNISMGDIRLGTGGVGIFNRKSDRGIWQNNGKIIFEGKCRIGIGAKISNNKKGKIVFGDNFYLTANSQIICYKSVSFGDNVLISWDCLIFDGDTHKVLNDQNIQTNLDEDINIGTHCWIGCRSVILKGCNIANNSIIAANSTISKSIEQENMIIGGLDKVLKKGVNWEK